MEDTANLTEITNQVVGKQNRNSSKGVKFYTGFAIMLDIVCVNISWQI